MGSYAETLREVYDGEVLGEALYGGLLAAAREDREDRERQVWGVLLQLERRPRPGCASRWPPPA